MNGTNSTKTSGQTNANAGMRFIFATKICLRINVIENCNAFIHCRLTSGGSTSRNFVARTIPMEDIIDRRLSIARKVLPDLITRHPNGSDEDDSNPILQRAHAT